MSGHYNFSFLCFQGLIRVQGKRSAQFVLITRERAFCNSVFGIDLCQQLRRAIISSSSSPKLAKKLISCNRKMSIEIYCMYGVSKGMRL